MPAQGAAVLADGLAEADPLPALRDEAERLGLRLIPISAVTGEGISELKRALWSLVASSLPEALAPRDASPEAP